MLTISALFISKVAPMTAIDPKILKIQYLFIISILLAKMLLTT